MALRIKYRVNKKVYTNESEFLKIEIIENKKVILRPTTKIELLSAVIIKPYDKKALIYCNGFQTWTDSGEYSYGMSTLHLGPLAQITNPIFQFKVVSDYSWCKQDKLVSHTYTYLKHGDTYTFIGTLNERSGFTSFHFKKHLEIHKDVEGLSIDSEFILFDFYVKEGNLDESLDEYFKLLNVKKCEVPYVLGYTSWYRHYQNINEEKLLDDLKALTSIEGYNPHLFQIDDGYQTFVGDWLDIDKNKFPNGLKPVVDAIKEKGLVPGLWFAPFIVEKNSRIKKEHPDWILMRGAYNWSGMYHLDLTKQEVKDYLHEVFTYYKDLGFKFFKLDFLYAACSVPQNGKTRAMLMYEGMEFLRSELEGCYILGCGVPLSSAFGVVEYCRIGQDVSLSDDSPWYMRLCHRERVSTKLTIKNTIARSHLDHRAFGNDPDVFVLRKTKMSEYMRLKLFKSNVENGSLILTSDNILELNEIDKERLINLSKLIDEKNKSNNYIPLNKK